MALDSPLLPVHRELGAKLVEFAGWRLPLQFTSVAEEAAACRQSAALFDISHMGLLRLVGNRARPAASRLVTRDVTAIPVGCAAYALLLDERAGILDDLFVMVESEAQVLLVVNAVNHEKDVGWMRRHPGAIPALRLDDLRGATFGIALQGPQAEEILRRAAPAEELPELFATIRRMRIAGAEVLVSRTGYTGEDGFEVFGEAERALEVWGALAGGGHATHTRPAAAGLAARDVLRQEMGYPLWGNDITEQTTPIEAGLAWAIDRDHEFIGRPALPDAPVGRKRLGFVIEGQGVARSGHRIVVNGEDVGVVTSGTYSHNLGAAIGQGYLSLAANPRPGMEVEVARSPQATATAAAGLAVEGRGKTLRARLASLPLTPARTRRSWRQARERWGRSATCPTGRSTL